MEGDRVSELFLLRIQIENKIIFFLFGGGGGGGGLGGGGGGAEVSDFFFYYDSKFKITRKCVCKTLCPQPHA